MPQVHPYLNDEAYARLVDYAKRSGKDVTTYCADVLYGHVGVRSPKHNRK